MVRAQLSSDEVKIEIEDRGAGIPEDERHRIFDIFIRWNEETVENLVLV